LRAVVQRVSRARVFVDGEAVAQIGAGLCVLVGVAEEDGEGDAIRLADKVAHLRIFANEHGKFDLSLLDTGGDALVVSQFTLIADSQRGTRPDFSKAAPPKKASRSTKRSATSSKQRSRRVPRCLRGAHGGRASQRRARDDRLLTWTSGPGCGCYPV
jgi:D-tyrosyl-tRNA(Tyr) deacylase